MRQLIAVNPDDCTGCKACEVVCSLSHYSECNPDRAAIRVVRKEKDGLVCSLPLVCQQCEAAPCIEACPLQALSRGTGQDTLAIDQGLCNGCGLCTEACPAGCIFIDGGKNVAIACDLCQGQPLCVDFCHARCLTLATYDPGNEGHQVERLARILAGENPFSVPLAEGRRA